MGEVLALLLVVLAAIVGSTTLMKLAEYFMDLSRRTSSPLARRWSEAMALAIMAPLMIGLAVGLIALIWWQLTSPPFGGGMDLCDRVRCM